jgi:hypothetical protein
LLETLLKAIGIDASVSDRESPDFAIVNSDRLVGVEVTEMHQVAQAGQLPLQTVASISGEIVQRAQRAYARAGGESLRVSVAFSPHARFQRVRRDEAGQLLLELVQRALRQAGTNLEWRPTYREDVRYAELFSHIHIYRQAPGFSPHWLVTTAGWVAPVTAELIQSRIDEKAIRIGTYRTAISEVWLVIGVRGTDPSQFFDFNTDDLGGTFRSPFDRTYVLDAFLGRALLLRTTS